MNGSPWQAGAGEIASAVRAGEVSAVEVFDSVEEKVAEVDPAIRAFLRRDPAGRERAESIDRRRAAGESLGPLAGVPVAVKDNISISGRPLTCGSRMLADYVAPYDATVVRHLLDADAVLLGQTNLDEFAMGSSCERSAFFATRNPWRLDRVPGGSSGGSAAAVAAAVPLALGSDTGGSIRQPAAFCGVAGLKPTYGRVSRRGLVAFASSTDQVGPIARRVSDLGLALSVLAGHDPRDATSSRRPVDRAALRASVKDTADLDGVRIGVLGEVAEADLAPGPARDWQRALDRLEGSGARLETVSVPSVDAAIACYYVLANCEASTNLSRFDGVRYGFRAELAPGDGLEALYVKSRSQGFGPEVRRRILLGTFALSSGYYEAYYGRAQKVRRTLALELAAALERVDVLVSPTAPSAAFRLGEQLADPLQMYLADVFTVPASLAGLPALSVPSGLDDDGLPLGLQITGRPFDEATVLRVGRAFERATGFEVRPEFLGPESDSRPAGGARGEAGEASA